MSGGTTLAPQTTILTCSRIPSYLRFGRFWYFSVLIMLKYMIKRTNLIKNLRSVPEVLIISDDIFNENTYSLVNTYDHRLTKKAVCILGT